MNSLVVHIYFAPQTSPVSVKLFRLHLSICYNTIISDAPEANLSPQHKVQSTHIHASQEVLYQFWFSEGLEGVPDADLEQCINRLGMVGGGVLEHCHHGAVDVHSRVSQVLLWWEEGASIAPSSLCVCAWAVAAKEGTSL